jgi:hypothetical protein
VPVAKTRAPDPATLSQVAVNVSVTVFLALRALDDRGTRMVTGQVMTRVKVVRARSRHSGVMSV